MGGYSGEDERNFERFISILNLLRVFTPHPGPSPARGEGDLWVIGCIPILANAGNAGIPSAAEQRDTRFRGYDERGRF